MLNKGQSIILVIYGPSLRNPQKNSMAHLGPSLGLAKEPFVFALYIFCIYHPIRLFIIVFFDAVTSLRNKHC